MRKNTTMNSTTLPASAATTDGGSRDKVMINKFQPVVPGNRWYHEVLRKFAAHTTESLARRRGDRLGMWLGCGYPKSGTVWLCQLMSSILDLPYPQNYMSPVAMPSVVHTHMHYRVNGPPTLYLVRDGRDVMVSFYHHRMRSLDGNRNPMHAKKLRRKLEKAFGKDFDPSDVRHNLPKYIRMEFAGEFNRLANWSNHVDQWTSSKNENVGVLRYEDLLSNGIEALGMAFEEVLGARFEPWIIEMAMRRFDFKRSAGRNPGSEDKSSFLRKGISQDWKNHFNREAANTFVEVGGDTLLRLGYEEDHTWVEGIGP